MMLTEAQIRYLLAIYKLKSIAKIDFVKHNIIRSSSIAESLSVTKPSVHKMLKQLASLGLIAKERYSMISITKEGQNIAMQYQNALYKISGVLQNELGIDANIAYDGTLTILSRIDTAGLATQIIS